MNSSTPAEHLIRQRLRTLMRVLPGAEKGDIEPIHQARVATRRLREALPLAPARGRARKLERRVRRLTQALGPVRELDVALQTLDALDTTGVPAAALGRLKQVIRQERRRLHADMCRALARVDLEKLRHQIGRLAPAGPRTSPALRDPKRLALARALAARRALRLRAAIDSAAGIYLPDRLHEVRIAGKKLRYALEVTRDLSGSRAAAGLRLLKEVQDLLGRMHDLEVLIARVRAIQGSSQAPNLHLSADLDRLVRRLETECRQIHSRYTGLRSKLVAVGDQTIAAAAGAPRGTPRARPAA